MGSSAILFGIAIDSSGNIRVADQSNSRLEEFSATGTYENQFTGSGNVYGPGGLSYFDVSGNLWVLNINDNDVLELPPPART